VVLLSEREGLPVSLLEGMASGVVPIGLRGAAGVTELVVDGVTGLLVGDRADEFVAAVRRLREDPALWDRLAHSARAKVEADHSEKVCADRWQELFHELVNSSGARKPLRIPRRLHLPPCPPGFGLVRPSTSATRIASTRPARVRAVAPDCRRDYCQTSRALMLQFSAGDLLEHLVEQCG
jgi:hypothetical protein